MITRPSLISISAIAGLMLAGPAVAQMPPVPPAPPRLPEAALERLDIDLENLRHELPALLAELQNPPAPPRPPRGQQERRDNRPQATEDFARILKVGAGSALLVSNISGSITVTAGAANEIDVKAVKRTRADSDEAAKRRLANVQIDVRATGNRVEIRAEPLQRSEGGAEVQFEIRVPPDCAVDLMSISGDVRVTNVKGELRTNVISGDIWLDSTSQLAAVKTVSGDIQITNSGGAAATAVSTVSGDVTANGLTTRSLDLNTVSGEFRIAGWAGERLNMRSMSGGLTLNGTLAKGGRYDMESHSGDIRLMLAEQPGFEIEANTFRGDVRIDFSIKSEGPVGGGSNRGPRAIRGTYGDSSASLRIQTFNGDISLMRK